MDLDMDEIAQHMDVSHRQVCIDLEKATQYITQVLQHEVGRNHELCVLIRRLEEREAEIGRILTEQAESNRQLRLNIDELQKHLEEKDNSLSQANQTVAFLRNELRDVHQQLQSQQINHRTYQDTDEWLQGGESQLKSPPFSSDGQRWREASVSEIKEEDADEDDDGYGEYSQPEERTDPGKEQTLSSAAIKTELIQEEDDKSNMPPVLCCKTDLSPTDPMSLAQIRGVSVLLVDYCRTQGQQGTDTENSRDGEQPETLKWKEPCTSSSAAFSGTPTSSCTQQTAVSSASSTEPEESGRFFDPLCDEGFSSPLKLHQRIHTRERRHHCTQCGKSFIREGHLKRHHLIHTGERPYHCTQCGKSFTLEGDLKKHQRTHTGERPYHCTQCGKSFTLQHHLHLHKRIHTGEKPYQCAQCGKSFTHEGNLKVHHRIHTGEKPFHCTLCGRSFSVKGNLKRHQCMVIGDNL
ncbi:zinc finger protein 613-like [Clupea harengus]|uniref:Zinc finger protein 613-like n=1 Tax=Clupea harengus TaxID=7950 RepID=A0A6P8F8U8_CLUHA|nr:zinc finger protein 613-like [Clupea harengus]